MATPIGRWRVREVMARLWEGWIGRMRANGWWWDVQRHTKAGSRCGWDWVWMMDPGTEPSSKGLFLLGLRGARTAAAQQCTDTLRWTSHPGTPNTASAATRHARPTTHLTGTSGILRILRNVNVKPRPAQPPSELWWTRRVEICMRKTLKEQGMEHVVVIWPDK